MINWMDNFNIYGIDAGRVGRLSNGPYASVAWADLLPDPDATAGGTYVLASTNTNFSFVRKVMPNPRTTLGALARFWLSALPSGPLATYFSFADVNSATHIFVYVDATGYLRVYRNDAASNVLIASSANPVIIANAWLHVEAKLVLDVAAGSVVIKVEGITVVNVAGIRTTSDRGGFIASIQNIILFGGTGNYGATTYIKDFIIWDNTTGFNNDFMGSCQVLQNHPERRRGLELDAIERRNRLQPHQ
jgi:hypothetical protein